MKNIPRLFFDMPHKWGVAVLSKDSVSWVSRGVDHKSADLVFHRLAARGTSAVMTYNGHLVCKVNAV